MHVQSAVENCSKYLAGYLVLIKDTGFLVFPTQTMFPHYQMFHIKTRNWCQLQRELLSGADYASTLQ